MTESPDTSLESHGTGRGYKINAQTSVYSFGNSRKIYRNTWNVATISKNQKGFGAKLWRFIVGLQLRYIIFKIVNLLSGFLLVLQFYSSD